MQLIEVLQQQQQQQPQQQPHPQETEHWETSGYSNCTAKEFVPLFDNWHVL